MPYTVVAALIAGGLFTGSLLMLELGRRLGTRRPPPSGAGPSGLGPIDGTIYGLLGLLIAFTFSGAAERFDERRHLVVDEANDIATAYLLLDLLPDVHRDPLRVLLRRYLDARLGSYATASDVAAAERERAAQLQREIWTHAVQACAAAPSPATTTLVLQSLSAMFDITTTRSAMTRIHPPTTIYLMLFGTALAASLFAGYAMGASRTRSVLHMVGFAAVLSIAIYVIIELEYPRSGLIRVDAIDETLIEVRQSMER